jgi:hypothetical protein
MSLREKLILVGFGAAICGGVAGGVIVFFGPGAPAPAVSPNIAPTSTPGLAVNPRPGALPALGGGAQQTPPPVAAPVPSAPASSPLDAVLAAEGTAAKRADPVYAAYRKRLEEAAPRLRALTPEEQSVELSRLAEQFAPKPSP